MPFVKLRLPRTSQGEPERFSVVNLDNTTRVVDAGRDISGNPIVKVFFVTGEDDSHTYALTLDEFLALGQPRS